MTFDANEVKQKEMMKPMNEHKAYHFDIKEEEEHRELCLLLSRLYSAQVFVGITEIKLVYFASTSK